MNTPGSATARLATPWTAVVVVSALLATAAFGGLLGPAGERAAAWLLGCRRALGAEGWRLLTGPLVHADADHLLRDLPIFAGLAWAVERRTPSFAALLLAALAVPTAAVLLLQPAFSVYGGLSGAINALVIVLVAQGLRGRAKAPLLLLGIAHGGKLIYEGCTGQLLFPLAVSGGAAAPLAHLVGALVGVFWTLGGHLGGGPGRGRRAGARRAPCDPLVTIPTTGAAHAA